MKQTQYCQKLSLLGVAEELQFKIHKLQQVSEKSVDNLGQAVFMDREGKEVRAQSRLKKQRKINFENFQGDKTRPVP